MGPVSRWTDVEVRALREALRFTKREFADVLGVTHRTITNWEEARVHISPFSQALLDGLASKADKLASERFELVLARAGALPTNADTRYGGAGDGASLARALSHGSTLTLDDLRHIAAALEDAHRYFDSNVVAHLHRRLADCALADGKDGPKVALPAVLGVVTAIDHNARKVRAVVRRGLLAVGAHGAEFAGWLYRDMGMPAAADYWRDRATEWSQEAGDHAMPGYILLKKSQSAWDERDGLRMLTLAQAVQNGPWPLPMRIYAEAAQQEARGHAMIDGDLDMAECKLDDARELFAKDTSPGGGRAEELAAHYDNALLTVQTAICYREAGRPHRAIDVYEEALLPEDFSRRDYGYFLSLKAETLVAISEPDQAAVVALEALNHARSTGSARTVQELSRLRDRFAPWLDRPAVRDFCHELAGEAGTVARS